MTPMKRGTHSVLGGNYYSTEQVNSIQQPIAYCFLTRTKVDKIDFISDTRNHASTQTSLGKSIPRTKDVEGRPDQESTEGIQEQALQSQIIQHLSTSSYPVPQDRWSKDQHIKLGNIIGDPVEGMLTRSMAAKLTTVSTSECLLTDFLSEIEPKKVSEALKHLGWIDAMQEELNQFYRYKVWTLVLLPYGKIAIDSKWEEGIDYDETFAPVVRIEDIGIFLSFATYMNFIVFQFSNLDVNSVFLNENNEEVYVKLSIRL
ncbi:retrovirus-related pol polyprotein from transposon TNT 1-94 [Tanacetum coccineum]